FGHCVLLSGNHWDDAVAWKSGGLYAAPGARVGTRPSGLLWLATALDAREIAAANRSGADGLFLSPGFPTRSHPDAKPLGCVGFHGLAAGGAVPVFAVGGMPAERAQGLGWLRAQAMAGLSRAIALRRCRLSFIASH